MKYIHLLFIVITYVACKNTSQSSTFSNSQNNKSLPREIANKTWVYIGNNGTESFKKILEYSELGKEANIKTTLDEISLEISELTPYKSYKITDVESLNDKTYLISAGKNIKIQFSLKDKTRGIANWKIQIPNYYDEGENFIEDRFAVNKTYVTPENFPIIEQGEKEIIDVEKEKPLNISLYSEVIEDLPIEGQFACDYKEKGDDYVFQGGKLSLSNEDRKVYYTGSNGKLKEIEKNVATITFEEYLTVQCDVRKIKRFENKYAFFYRNFINTKFSVDNAPYYSKTQPIAEIEIIDNNTIRKKWLGFYNQKTKQQEDAEDFGWQDEYCDVIKRVN